MATNGHNVLKIVQNDTRLRHNVIIKQNTINLLTSQKEGHNGLRLHDFRF